MSEFDNFQGVNCPDDEESRPCSPKVIRDEYTFNFARGSAAKALVLWTVMTKTYVQCFIAGADQLSTGDKRGIHAINYHSVDQNDEGTHKCTGTGPDNSEVSVSYTITTFEE